MTWSRFNLVGASMKAVSTAIITVLLVGATSVCCYADGNMIGRDSTYRGGSNGVSHGGSGGGVAKGKCPEGTCSKAGTPYAMDVKYCSAANCKK
jgi:hypothetical protein